MTVREMLGRIDSRELSEWMAYASIEPIGEKRMDMRFAVLNCTIVNLIKSAVGDKGKSAEPEDFMFTFDPPKQQTPEQMKAMLGIRGK